MSLYYEFKSCCGKEDERRERATEGKQGCFCGKFLENFIGQQLYFRSSDGTVSRGTVIGIDRKSGIVTLADVETLLETGFGGRVPIAWGCCSSIIGVSRGPDNGNFL